MSRICLGCAQRQRGRETETEQARTGQHLERHSHVVSRHSSRRGAARHARAAQCPARDRPHPTARHGAAASGGDVTQSASRPALPRAAAAGHAQAGPLAAVPATALRARAAAPLGARLGAPSRCSRLAPRRCLARRRALARPPAAAGSLPGAASPGAIRASHLRAISARATAQPRNRATAHRANPTAPASPSCRVSRAVVVRRDGGLYPRCVQQLVIISRLKGTFSIETSAQVVRGRLPGRLLWDGRVIGRVEHDVGDTPPQTRTCHFQQGLAAAPPNTTCRASSARLALRS
jgi:hypothetical protein